MASRSRGKRQRHRANPAGLTAALLTSLAQGAGAGAAASLVARALAPRQPNPGHVVTSPGGKTVLAAYYGHPAETFRRAAARAEAGGDIWFSLARHRYRKGESYRPSILERAPVVSHRARPKNPTLRLMGGELNPGKRRGKGKASRRRRNLVGSPSLDRGPRPIPIVQSLKTAYQANPKGGNGHRKIATLPLAAAKGAPGYEVNVRARTRFHGSPPDRVTVIRIPDGKRTVTRKVVFAVGQTPEIVYEGPKNSTKAGSTYVHEFTDGGGRKPLVVHDAVTGVSSFVGGTYRVSDWYRR